MDFGFLRKKGKPIINYLVPKLNIYHFIIISFSLLLGSIFYLEEFTKFVFFTNDFEFLADVYLLVIISFIGSIVSLILSLRKSKPVYGGTSIVLFVFIVDLALLISIVITKNILELNIIQLIFYFVLVFQIALMISLLFFSFSDEGQWIMRRFRTDVDLGYDFFDSSVRPRLKIIFCSFIIVLIVFSINFLLSQGFIFSVIQTDFISLLAISVLTKNRQTVIRN